MDKKDIDNFIDGWYKNIANKNVFIFLNHSLFNVMHLPDSGFKDVYKQLDNQIEKLIKYEYNERMSIDYYNNIGEIYQADFDMIYRLTSYLGKIWPDLYTEKLVSDINQYVKYYEKYIFKMF